MTDSKKKKPPLTASFRLPKDLDYELGMEAQRRGVFKYELVRDLWQEGKANIPKSSHAIGQKETAPDTAALVTSIPEEVGGWEIEFLREILASDNEIARAAIRSNLIAFREFASGGISDADAGSPQPRIATALREILRDIRLLESGQKKSRRSLREVERLAGEIKPAKAADRHRSPDDISAVRAGGKK